MLMVTLLIGSLARLFYWLGYLNYYINHGYSYHAHKSTKRIARSLCYWLSIISMLGLELDPNE